MAFHHFKTSLPVAVLALAGVTAPLHTLAAQRASNQVLPSCDGVLPGDSLRAQLSDPAVFRPDPRNGTFAAEIETAPLAGGWVRESALAGFSGGAFYRWAGANLYSSPGQGVLAYRFEADAAGRYRLAIHNRHDHPDSSLNNDCWVRVNGGTWWKLYSNTGSNVRVWNWHSRLDPGHGYADFDFQAGINLVEVSGRSNGFMIDRLHAYPVNFYGALSLDIQSRRTWKRPVLGSDYGLRLGDPQAATDLQAGQIMAMLMLSAERHADAPCGLLVPGFGAHAGQRGELLLADAPTPFTMPVVVPVPADTRVGELSLAIPSDPALAGSQVFVQGVLFDGRRAVLTQALKLQLGDR